MRPSLTQPVVFLDVARVAAQVADGKIAISAFVGAPMGVPDQTVGKLFTPIEVSTLYYDAERVGRECATCLLHTFQLPCERRTTAACKFTPVRAVLTHCVSVCG
jgi:hypothetical protein